jgi:ABC-type Fe3+/spermidine/putrescine transport system ATPase subunit
VNATAITLKNVTKRFRSQLALDGLSLEVASGTSTVVLGPSGCGKTTLLRIIAGLEAPDSGEVLLNGVIATTAQGVIVPPHERRLGFVFQDLALWPHLTARENVEFVLGSMKRSRAERTRLVQAALALVRIESLADRFPHELSGGEQQRLALARAIAGEPRVLLLDEPLSSLDPELRAVLRAQLAALQAALNLTMIYVTHDREDAAALAHSVVEMRAGRVIEIHRDQNRGQERT